MMPVVPTISWPGALAPVPDLPRWVEARSLVLGGRGRIVAQEPARDAWIALALDASVGVVVGHPSAEALARAVAAGRTRTTWVWPDPMRRLAAGTTPGTCRACTPAPPSA